MLKQTFDVAVGHKIASSPFNLVKIKSKKPSLVKRQSLTIEPFEEIIRAVRAAPISIYAQTSAAFIEFLGVT